MNYIEFAPVLIFAKRWENTPNDGVESRFENTPWVEWVCFSGLETWNVMSFHTRGVYSYIEVKFDDLGCMTYATTLLGA